jgi:hypothetical protein
MFRLVEHEWEETGMHLAKHPEIAGGSVHHVQAARDARTGRVPLHALLQRHYSADKQEALSLPGKGPDLPKLVAGRDLNPRPLGYEPYDARLCRLGRSLVVALTSAYGRRASSPMPRVSPVSNRPVASRAQIRFLTYG